MKDYEEKLEELGYQFDEEGNYWYQPCEELMLRIEVNGQYGHINYGIYGNSKYYSKIGSTWLSQLWDMLESHVEEIEKIIKRS